MTAVSPDFTYVWMMWDLLKLVITFHKGSLMIWNCCQMDSRRSAKLWSNVYVMDLFITTIHTIIHLVENYSYDQYQSPRYPHKSPNYIYSSQCYCVSWCSKCILRRKGSTYKYSKLLFWNLCWWWKSGHFNTVGFKVQKQWVTKRKEDLE